MIYKTIRADKTSVFAANCRHRMKYRKRFEDLKMNLLVDKKQNAIPTLVERSTSFLLMARIHGGKKDLYLLVDSAGLSMH